MNDTPIAFNWDGEAMAPANRRFALMADKAFVVGETYVLVAQQQRSAETHRHYFACIHDAWLNLPEDITDELPTSEHLRAWALVKTGFADKDTIKCASNDDAIKLASVAKSGSKIRIVEVVGKIVTIWTPHSQSMRAMGKAEFQRSKTAVLDVLAGMVRVEPQTLVAEAGRAA